MIQDFLAVVRSTSVALVAKTMAVPMADQVRIGAQR